MAQLKQTPSRGYAVSAYLSCFRSPATSGGAKIYGNDVQSGVITSAHIASGTVVAADVGTGAITSAKLGAAAVRGTKISAGGITSSHIAAATIAGTNIKANAITSAKIGAAAIRGAKISAGGITSAHIAASTITSSNIKAGTVKYANIKVQYITGTVSANIGAFALSHTLGAVPACVVVGPRNTSAAITGTGSRVCQSSVSANTSTIIYLAAGSSAAKFSLIAIA